MEKPVALCIGGAAEPGAAAVGTGWQTLCKLNGEVSADSALPLPVTHPNGRPQTFKD